MAKTGPKPRTDITKADLEREYVEKGLSMHTIRRKFHCGETLIHNLIHRYGIPVRPKRESLKGRVFSKEHRLRLSQAHIGKCVGEKNYNWKGGVTERAMQIRLSGEYQRWRRRVLRFKGDFCAMCHKDLNEGCPTCGNRPDKHVHHTKDFNNHPELRFEVDNAQVLCYSCHLSQHKKMRH